MRREKNASVIGVRGVESARRGFTIAELMIVLIILGVVLSIILPSLRAVSARAKAAVTTTTMSSLASAGGLFSNDNNGRAPGYFTAAQMGHQANDTRGMPAMTNILLDLMPGVTAKPAMPGTGVIEIGPTTGDVINLDLNQYAGTRIQTPGGQARSYFRPDPKYFFAPIEEGGNAALARQGQESGTLNHLYVPNLHDAYGSPILAWQEDDRAANTFAARDSSTNPGTVARFYWASNACFLRAKALGRLQTNQDSESMLRGTGSRSGDPLGSMTGLLGNPAFPGNGFDPIKARGPLVFHSAGANGVFLGEDERGAKTAVDGGGAPRPLFYIPGQDPFRNGDFDDLVVSAGN
ncbi:MAG: type II secretion system protein [Phycisphaerales bacterium]